MTKSRVVIVGGGYIGIELAKALETDLDVTLVEPNDAFVLTTAMIRAVVEPGFLDKGLIPYDRLLAKGKVVRDRATQVDGTGVDLASGERLEAEFVVIATGSRNAAAFKPAGDGISALREASARMHRQIAEAERIVIIGAGAVGTELAGEIAHAMPEKSVALISSDSTLFPSMPRALGRGLARKLGAMGVEILFGKRAADLQSPTEPFPGPVHLSDGQELAADLVIPAIGARPNTVLLEGLPEARMGGQGRIAVDGHLRPSRLENVFAAGDAVDAGDAMTVVAASRQGPWLAKTLKARAGGKPLDQIKPYKPWSSPPILVPLGPERGNSFLMVATVGDWVTRQMKGRDLFVPKYRKILGHD